MGGSQSLRDEGGTPDESDKQQKQIGYRGLAMHDKPSIFFNGSTAPFEDKRAFALRDEPRRATVKAAKSILGICGFAIVFQNPCL
jgi:hypothetical protein